MALLAAILAAALTRAEIIDRMRAAPVTRLEGLVQVVGDCPPDMRREYMHPVAVFVSGVCQSLYEMEKIRPVRFESPGIVVYLGDTRTNRTDLVVRERRRENGAPYTYIRVHAPAFADLDALGVAAARGFYLAVKGERIDDAAAEKALCMADPERKAAYDARQLEAWFDGRPADGDDEHFLRMLRTVTTLGRASTAEVLRYAAGLRLYPALHAAPFCGGLDSCTFREAIDLARRDPRVRIQAFLKRPEVALFACGRGEALCSAAQAYSDFLADLAAGKTGREELLDMLEDADAKLNAAFEEAHRREVEEQR